MTLVTTRGTSVTVTGVRAPNTVGLSLGGRRVSLRRLSATCSILVRRDHDGVAGTRRTVDRCVATRSTRLSVLSGVPRVIQRITKTLHFLRLPTLTGVFDRLTDFVRDYLSDLRPLDRRALDRVTSMLVSMSCHLRNVRGGQPIGGHSLSINRRDLDRLLTTWPLVCAT